MHLTKLSGKTPQRVGRVAAGLALLLTLSLAGRSGVAASRSPEIRAGRPGATWVSYRVPRRERTWRGPGTHVRWIHFPPQKHPSKKDWGPFLTDIDNHLPESFGDHYSSDDLITHAHETTHGINSYITDTLNRTGKQAYGFYVGDDRALVLVEPKVKLSQVAAAIPKSVRGSRYQLYLKEQQQYFEDHPLYVFDEWTAYINGARAGIEQARRSAVGWDRRCDAVVGALELGIYSLGVARAVEKHDPEYLKRNPQFLEFLAHELRRAVDVYKQGIVMGPFRWERNLEVSLVKGNDTQPLRRTLQNLYGPDLSVNDLLSPPDWAAEPLLATADSDAVQGADLEPGKPKPGSIEGTVQDEGERLQPDLEVLLKDAEGKDVAKTKTNAIGKFVFKDVAPGKYKVFAQKFSGAKGEKAVEVAAGAKVTVKLVVER